ISRFDVAYLIEFMLYKHIYYISQYFELILRCPNKPSLIHIDIKLISNINQIRILQSVRIIIITCTDIFNRPMRRMWQCILISHHSDFNYADGLNKDTVMGDENTLPHPPHRTVKDIGTSNYYYANQLKNPDLIDVTEKLDIYEDEGWFSWTTEDWVKELTNDEK